MDHVTILLIKSTWFCMILLLNSYISYQHNFVFARCAVNCLNLVIYLAEFDIENTIWKLTHMKNTQNLLKDTFSVESYSHSSFYCILGHLPFISHNLFNSSKEVKCRKITYKF